MLPAEAKRELIALLGPRGYLERPEDLLLYEYDGSIDKARPEMVVFPRSTEDVVAIVKITAKHNVPIVGRGAGTGLSGGAIPRAGAGPLRAQRLQRPLGSESLEKPVAAAEVRSWQPESVSDLSVVSAQYTSPARTTCPPEPPAALACGA